MHVRQIRPARRSWLSLLVLISTLGGILPPASARVAATPAIPVALPILSAPAPLGRAALSPTPPGISDLRIFSRGTTGLLHQRLHLWHHPDCHRQPGSYRLGQYEFSLLSCGPLAGIWPRRPRSRMPKVGSNHAAWSRCTESVTRGPGSRRSRASLGWR